MRWILLILFFAIRHLLFSQDVIYLNDNSKIEVQLISVSDSTIIYKKFNHLTGPDYVIRKTDAVLILYQNGKHLVIPAITKKTSTQLFIDEYWRRKDSVQNAKMKQMEEKYTRYTALPNQLFCNALEFANLGIGIDYTRELFKNHFLFFASVSASAGKLLTETDGYTRTQYNYYIDNYKLKTRNINASLGFLINCSRKKLVTYNLGPGIRIAQYTGGYDIKSYTTTYQDSAKKKPIITSSNTPHTFVLNAIYLQLYNTILIRCSEKINLMLYADLSVYRFFDYLSGNPNNYLPPYYRFQLHDYKQLYSLSNSNYGISIGYRFKLKK